MHWRSAVKEKKIVGTACFFPGSRGQLDANLLGSDRTLGCCSMRADRHRGFFVEVQERNPAADCRKSEKTENRKRDSGYQQYGI